MKSFVILISILIITISAVVFGLNMKALREPHQRHHHPLAHLQNFEIIYQGGSLNAPANTWTAIDRALADSPNHLIWVDVHQSKENTFVLYGADYMDRFTNGEGHIWNQTDAQLAELDAGYQFQDKEEKHSFRGQGIKIPMLEETLTKYPFTNFVLNIISNKDGTDQKLSALIKEHKIADRIILASPFDVILRSMRALDPALMFGTGKGELTRLIMFDSLGLAALVPIKGDVILSADTRVTRAFGPSLIAEANRRKKLIVSGLIKDEKSRTAARNTEFHGLLRQAVNGR